MRLIEESGGIVETSPQNFVRATSNGFEQTLHFEKDNHWERFGTNPEFIDNPAYTSSVFASNMYRSADSESTDSIGHPRKSETPNFPSRAGY